MEILIADKLSPRTVLRLEGAGHRVRQEAQLTGDTLPGAIGAADILVVRSTKVTAATLAAGSKLSLVIRAGAGTNTIDVAEASRRGIYVANCPGKNTDAVAELTIGLIVAADRRIADATIDLRSGKWRKGEYGKARGLRGRTLGILGLGSIGKRVAAIAQAMGMQVVAWSRSLTTDLAESLDIGWCGSPAEVAKIADVLSIHVAAAPETERLIDTDLLALLPDGAIVVNTSRGETVDEQAMAAAIASRGIRYATDVFRDEPAGNDGAFDKTEFAGRVTATPHIGASTDQASEAIADEVVRIVDEFLATGRPPGTVNLQQRSPDGCTLVVRHLNKVGVLAGILDALREEGINVLEMENVIFKHGIAACCSLRLDGPPSAGLVERLEQVEAHASVQVRGSRS